MDTLNDVVFRRTELGTAGNHTDMALERAASLMASACGWSYEHQMKELSAVREKTKLLKTGRAMLADKFRRLDANY